MEACIEDYSQLSKTGVKILRDFVQESLLSDKTDEQRASDIKLKIEELLEEYPLPVIRFIDFDTFEQFGSCPRYPDNKEVTTPLSEIDRDNSLLVFISHCWMRGHRDAEGWDGRHHPDNAAGDKFQLIVKGIKRLKAESAPRMSHCYIWLDFGCVNQDKKSNLKDELERYDKIVECCDAIFTLIVDYEHASWSLPKAYENLFDSYKAKLWNDGPHAYLNRAWCRLEMLYAANIPVLDNSNGVKRHTMFEAGLAFQSNKNRRPHYLFGSKEGFRFGMLQVLPPLQNIFLTRYHPIDGYLSVADDIYHVKFLLNELQPYIEANRLTMFIYKGSYNSKGEMHGFGHFKDINGTTYEGDFVNDELSGQGKVIFAYGDVYEGQLENGLIHGYGIYKFANGTVYEGDHHCCMRQGNGVLKSSTGVVYEGQFFDSMRTGKGVLHMTSGDVYSGDFVDDCYCGFGTLTLLDGTQYAGDFVDDCFHGQGRLTKNGDSYEGDFIQGAMEGQGVMKFANGNVYEGSFKNNDKNGFGKYYYKHGDTHEGNYVANRWHGYGVYRHASGETYKGDFKDDTMHGRGVHTFVNGIVYEGDFHDNVFINNGTYRYPNGDVFEVNNLFSVIIGFFVPAYGKKVTIHYDIVYQWTYK